MLAACVQMSSGAGRAINLARAAELIAEAAAAGASLALLPENFSFMGSTEAERQAAAEKESDSSVLRFLSEQSRQHAMLIVGGTTLLQGKSGRLRNACAVFLPDGKLAAIYDKMHLFDVELAEEQHVESAIVEAGQQPLVAGEGDWKLGLSVCYDLRFPELYRYYRNVDCNILTVPAAFTVPTGKAHWEVLLRARAIENQCYVLAAGQCGEHPGGRKTWGHSMIVDAWGTVVASIEQQEGIVTAELSLDSLNEIRRRMPVQQHRRM